MSILWIKTLLLSIASILHHPLEVIEGTLIECDSQDQLVTFIPNEGIILHVVIDVTSLAFDSEGNKLNGFEDSSLLRGVAIKLVLSRFPRMVKELRVIPQQATPESLTCGFSVAYVADPVEPLLHFIT